MTTSTQRTTTTTTTNIGVVMFTVADQDAAERFYVGTLGWELRGDTRFGENGEYRWLEVAPPGSTTRLALNPPMNDQPGGGCIGVETTDLQAEHAFLTGIAGIELGTCPTGSDTATGVPPLFMFRDPDGNAITVVQVS
ncbi:VOC family protein [Pseudonocardia phyllosphaerae]|uniref:VOC family protein n=1 Tax=Pseudonocardia phyllosphaerae TaxID=3390502 RepID=UPI0039784CF1